MYIYFSSLPALKTIIHVLSERGNFLEHVCITQADHTDHGHIQY